MFSGISIGNTMLITASGIVIVFLVLLLLIIIFALFGLFSKIKSKPKDKKPAEVKPITKVQPAATVQNNDDELIAVISAAALEYLSDDGKTYAVRSIKRSKGERSPWATAGILQNNSSFTK